jgi:hypothetical protein
MSILGQAQKYVYIETTTKICLYWDSHTNMPMLGQPQKHVYIGTGTKYVYFETTTKIRHVYVPVPI